MAMNFDKYASKGNEMVGMLADDLQVPRDKAARILKAVLHGMRNQLSTDESLQVVAQLPMMLKAVYVDQWNPSRTFRRIHTLEEFFDMIRGEDGNMAAYDFGNNESAKKNTRAVFRTLNYYLSEGEFNDVKAVLPAEIKKFIADSIGEGRKAL